MSTVREALLDGLPSGGGDEGNASRGRRSWGRWAVLLALVGSAAVLTPLVGTESIDYGRALGLVEVQGPNVDAFLLFDARLPRVLFALVAGAALAIAGAVYQAILRNDLAEPFSLGVATGGALGALLFLNLGPAWAGVYTLPAGGFAGAAVAVAAINALARMRGTMRSPATLLLAGVTLNVFFAAGILLVQYISDPYQTLMLLRWMMGGLDVASLEIVQGVALVLVAVAVVLMILARPLDLLTFGEESAHNLGVPVERVRLLGLGAASFVTAVVVAFAGPIGFVGLVVPHAMRRVFGAGHVALLPACLLGGAAFLPVCDAVGRLALGWVTGSGAAELPVGIVTALVGAPFFLYLLARKG